MPKVDESRLRNNIFFEKVEVKKRIIIEIKGRKIQIPVDNKIGGEKIIDRENAIVNSYNV